MTTAGVKTLIRAGRLLTVSPAGTLSDGGLAVDGDTIAAIGPWDTVRHDYPEANVLEASGLTVSPGLVDCHTHNLEFGSGTTWGTGQDAQFAGAASLMFEALRAGVTAMGEHVLGHYAFRREIGDYREFARWMPQTVRFCTGGGVIGTEPVVCFCAVAAGGSVSREVLLAEDTLRQLASLNEFPGECFFVTVTPANLPVEATPHAGERFMTREEMARVIHAYQADGHRVGAHIEGVEAIREFAQLGGNVVHHGHGLTRELLPTLADSGVMLCATPAGGTRRRPNSPDEIADAVAAGLTVAVATDAVLPIHPEVDWYDRPAGDLVRSSDLMYLARPAMQLMLQRGRSENEALALITLNGARVLGLEDRVGSLEVGKQADLLFSQGVPGLDVVGADGVKGVMLRGDMVIGLAA